MTETAPRRFLTVFEPLVAMIYFSPEAHEEYTALGLEDGWSAYFGSRSAAMGAVSPETVASTFYNFNPDLIRRTLRWDLASPADVYAARLRGARRTLERLWADGAGPSDLERVGELMRVLVGACAPEGRPIAAPHAALPWPDDPILGAWHGANVMREFRGDGHVAVLTAHQVHPVEALHLQRAYIGLKGRAREAFFFTRQWDAEILERKAAALRARRFLSDDDELTDGGAKFRLMLEHETDRLAEAPFAALGADGCGELYSLLEAPARTIVERKGVPSGLARLDPANPLT